jgi:hypothetical protein
MSGQEIEKATNSDRIMLFEDSTMPSLMIFDVLFEDSTMLSLMIFAP